MPGHEEVRLWILTAILELKRQRQQPNEEHISKILLKSHGVGRDKSLHHLKLCVLEGSLTFIWSSNGMKSYKELMAANDPPRKSHAQFRRLMDEVVSSTSYKLGVTKAELEGYLRTSKCLSHLKDSEFGHMFWTALNYGLGKQQYVINGQYIKMKRHSTEPKIKEEYYDHSYSQEYMNRGQPKKKEFNYSFGQGTSKGQGSNYSFRQGTSNGQESNYSFRQGTSKGQGSNYSFGQGTSKGQGSNYSFRQGTSNGQESNYSFRQGTTKGQESGKIIKDYIYMLEMTESRNHREEGNEFYKSSQADGLSPCVKKRRLGKATSCYTNAIKTAENNQDAIASAAKNHAKASWAMANLGKDDYKEVGFFYKEAFTHFSKSIAAGRQSKPLPWRNDLMMSFTKMYEEAVCWCYGLDTKPRIQIFESFVEPLEDTKFRSDIWLEIGIALLHEAISAVGKKDFKNSMCYLKELNRPIEEIKMHGNEELLEKIEEMEVDQRYQMALTESIQAIFLADKLLDDHLLQYEDVNMDLIYSIIDQYRQAIILARELEIEVEAIAWSRLGKLYDQVLKIKYRATKAFERCLLLANSLFPRVMTSSGWYKVATDTLRKYQKESILEHDAEVERERQKYLQELKPEMTKLREAQKKHSSEDEELLLFIYKEFPLKTTNKSLPTCEDLEKMSRAEKKKTFQKAVVYYHPDKVDVEKYGMKWKVLCGELLKS